MDSIRYTTQILRLPPQNDITTQSLGREDERQSCNCAFIDLTRAGTAIAHSGTTSSCARPRARLAMNARRISMSRDTWMRCADNPTPTCCYLFQAAVLVLCLLAHTQNTHRPTR